MDYISSGTINFGGCSEHETDYFYTYKFGINKFAWIKQKAHFGILEKIAIKSVSMPYPYAFVYKDSLNSWYNEEELITNQEAVDLAISYWEYVQYSAANNIKNC